MQAWSESLGGISYPLLSDFWPHGVLAEKYGVLRSEDGVTERAIFIIDAQGIIRYIDNHDFNDLPDVDVLLNEVAKINPQTPAAQKAVEPAAPDLPVGGVVMYCTSWCPACRTARGWFKKHDIPYTEVDIDRVPGAKDQLRKWTGGNLSTPTFNINGRVIIDFDVQQINEALGRQ